MSVFSGMLSLHEAADVWRIHESTIRKVITKKFIYGEDCRKFGKQWVVTDSSMKRVFGSDYDVDMLHDILANEFSE